MIYTRKELPHLTVRTHILRCTDSSGVTATTYCTSHSAPPQLNSFTPPSVFKPDAPHSISQPFPATADQLNPTSSPPYITHELYPSPSFPPPQACQPLSPLLGLQCLFPAFPVFNADRDIDWWITQFKSMTADCHLADKCRLLILKLGDRVKYCFTLLPEYMHHDYAALKHQLQETYGTLINDRVYYAELMNRRKPTNETMLAYLNDIKRLVGDSECTYRKETNTFAMLFFMD